MNENRPLLLAHSSPISSFELFYSIVSRRCARGHAQLLFAARKPSFASALVDTVHLTPALVSHPIAEHCFCSIHRNHV